MSGTALESFVRGLTDTELRRHIEHIVGNPKLAGSQARRLGTAEVRALIALKAEEARRQR